MRFSGGPIGTPGPDRYTQTAIGQNTVSTTLSATGWGLSSVESRKLSGKAKSAAVTRTPPPIEVRNHFVTRRMKASIPLGQFTATPQVLLGTSPVIRRNVKGRPFWSRVWVLATIPTERNALNG